MSTNSPSPVLMRRHGWLSLGEKLSDPVSLYGRKGVPQAPATATVRQVLEGLGAVAVGGSDTTNTDALSKVADDTIADGVDYAVGTSTGTKIGTGATQKLGFYGATPIVRPANTVDMLTALVNLGLLATGGSGLSGPTAAVTATTGGGTTGVIPDNVAYAQVTSSVNTKAVTLPTPTPGKKLTIDVGANGYKLQSSSPSTVAINGGTGSSAVSAIAANSTVELRCIDATHWKAFQMAADGTLSAVAAAA